MASGEHYRIVRPFDVRRKGENPGIDSDAQSVLADELVSALGRAQALKRMMIASIRARRWTSRMRH